MTTDSLKSALERLAPTVDVDRELSVFRHARVRARTRRRRTLMAGSGLVALGAAVLGGLQLRDGGGSVTVAEMPTETTPTTLRPCALLPTGLRDGDPLPDGTYVASGVGLSPGTTDQLTFYIDNGGAGFNFEFVPIAEDPTTVGLDLVTHSAGAVAEVVANRDEPVAITVDSGEITALDVVHNQWDMNSSPGECQR